MSYAKTSALGLVAVAALSVAEMAHAAVSIPVRQRRFRIADLGR